MGNFRLIMESRRGAPNPLDAPATDLERASVSTLMVVPGVRHLWFLPKRTTRTLAVLAAGSLPDFVLDRDEPAFFDGMGFIACNASDRYRIDHLSEMHRRQLRYSLTTMRLRAELASNGFVERGPEVQAWEMTRTALPVPDICQRCTIFARLPEVRTQLRHEEHGLVTRIDAHPEPVLAAVRSGMRVHRGVSFTLVDVLRAVAAQRCGGIPKIAQWRYVGEEN